MRKSSVIILVIATICVSVFASGCSRQDNLSEPSTSKVERNSSALMNSDFCFDIYSNVGDDDSLFNSICANNEVDKAYCADFDKASTTQEMVELENKYVDIWKKEIQRTLAQLQKSLNASDYIELLNSQVAWENQVLACANSDRSIIENGEYGIEPGSSFRWLWLSNIRQQYRERSLHLEYLLFLVNGSTTQGRTGQ